MAQSTTNLGKIHVFPSETLYNQFKDIIADNDLALLKDDGAYIVAALLEQNGYVKFSNGLILQWGIKAASTYTWTYPLPLAVVYYADMMGYRKGSAGSEYGWIRSISPIAFETYIIDESAICFCIGIA